MFDLNKVNTVMADCDEQFVKAFMLYAEADDGNLFFELFPPLAEFPATPEGIAGFARMMENAPQVSMSSNVGRLAPLPAATPFQVEALSFALSPMFSHVLFNAVSTFNGRMTLNINFDAARLPLEQARSIITDLAATLARVAAGSD